MAEDQRKKKKSGSKLIFIAGLAVAIVLLPTTFVFVIGMLPSLVAFIAENSRKKTLYITVGSMNFTGCSVFVMDLWKRGQTMDVALDMLMDPMTIIIIYSSAGLGYAINWGITEVVSKFLKQKARRRLKDIKKRKEYLVQRWGREVLGENLVVETASDKKR